MNILIVTKKRLRLNDAPIEICGHHVYFRSSPIGLHCIAANMVILEEGLSEKQIELAKECARRGGIFGDCIPGKVFELKEIT